GVTRTWRYEADTLPGRLLAVMEQPAGEALRITERRVWAGNTPSEQALNLAGQCVRHYDTAGLNQLDSLALTGGALSVTRQLLPDTATADWQGEDESAWNDLLASECFTTRNAADAQGGLLTSTDARGNLQRLAYDVAGQLKGSWLTLKDAQEQVIVKSLTYSAAGQKLREEHGNGVVTSYTYEPETQRLIAIKTERPSGHAAGAKVLQDLRYDYDPVGNVLHISNDAEATRFWRNQKVVPENTYVYDTLYQLVSATGRELAGSGQQGSHLPPATVPLPADNSTYTNYTRSYSYDPAGNLTQIRHSAPATGNNYTRAITVSDRSNRAVLSTLTETPSAVDALFDAGGHQRQLQPGQSLVWTPRGELQQVTPVVREGQASDSESYRYDAGSQRLLKVSSQQTSGSRQTQRVQYLPGLELRTTANGSTETENLQVITVGEAGRAQVRVLHWASGLPAGMGNNQARYSYDNLVGSSGLEVDGSGNVISQEEYYPYGGTALW
ncbi:TPA: RHS repeat protein, partial [Pseudomonas aeruginosa]